MKRLQMKPKSDSVGGSEGGASANVPVFPLPVLSEVRETARRQAEETRLKGRERSKQWEEEEKVGVSGVGKSRRAGGTVNVCMFVRERGVL